MKTVTYLDSIFFRKEVQDGIKNLAEITSKTLGPGGRAVLLEQENGSVLATKDGVTVARHYVASSPIQKLVAKAAIEASERTVRSCGDGTTTSMLLAAAIVEAGQEYLEKHPGHSPQALARELKTSLDYDIIPKIHSYARSIRDLDADDARKAIHHVAMVSSNSDIEIADAVTQAVELVGEDGMVQIEEGTGLKTIVTHQKGFPVNSGLNDLGGVASLAFVNRKANSDCAINGAYICLYDGEINDQEIIFPLLQKVAGEVDEKGVSVKSPLVIAAHAFSDTVLAILANNFRKGTLTVVPFVTPRNGQASGKQSFLYDLQAYVGGAVFEPQGLPLTAAQPANIGFCEDIKISQFQSVFMTEPDADAIEKRVTEIKEQMSSATEFDQDKMRYRLGQLTGGIAVIYSGGPTSFEAKERRDRVVDAVSAVRSAIEMGVVPGGGATLLQIARELSRDQASNEIFVKALRRPFAQILLNAGVASNEEEALFNGNSVGLDTETKTFMVFDALKRTNVEFWESGIFDPAKVTVNAVQNALSVAQLLMTTGGAIARQVSEAEEQIQQMQKGMMSAMNME
jgi:chaperonin GroEL